MKTLLFALYALLFLSACNKKIDHLISGRVIDVYDSTGVEGMNVYVTGERTLVTDENGQYSGTFEVDTKTYSERIIRVDSDIYNTSNFINHNGYEYQAFGQLSKTSNPTNNDPITDFTLYKIFRADIRVDQSQTNGYYWNIKTQIRSLNGELTQIKQGTYYYGNNFQVILTEGSNDIEIYIENRDNPNESYTIIDNVFVDKDTPPTNTITYEFP
ncbi:MAG: hypothetical protein ACI9XP_000902 [Lentimonas sp.]|jgi:hypothetical protein